MLLIKTVQSSGPLVIQPSKYLSALQFKLFVYEIGKTANSEYALVEFELAIHVHFISPLCCGFIPRI